MRFVFTILAIIAIAAVGRLLSVIVPATGIFATLEPVLVQSCVRIDVAPGTEDIAIDHERGLAYISTDNRRAWYAGEIEKRPDGDIYALDLTAENPIPIKASIDRPADFSPHGISLWKGPNGEQRLFVVNHPKGGGEVIEIFDILDDGMLHHVESIIDEAIYSPNDVVAFGPRHFYATNDRRYDKGLLGTLEAYLALPLTNIVVFDGESAREVQSGLIYANGINLSADGNFLFVAEAGGRRIKTFDRDSSTNVIKQRQTIRLKTAPDNIDVGEDGMLYVGAHPKVLAFIEHAEDETAVAPSHVVKINPKTGEHETIFMSVDGEINASAVGAVGASKLLVGAVFDGHILSCPYSITN